MPTSGRAVYGPLAERFSGCFAPDEPVVILDHIGAAEGLRDCVARRFNGERFLVRAVLQRVQAARADLVAPSILRSFSGLDDRRIVLEQAWSGTLQANGRVLSALPVYDAPALRLMQAALRLADALVVSSEAERRRVQDILGWDPPCLKSARKIAAVPAPQERSNPESVLIWAPHLSGDVAYQFVLALSELHIPLQLVSHDRPADCALATWIPAGQHAAALASAALVVDTDAFSCDTALVLAEWGVPLVCDVESGAQEHLDEIRVFDRSRTASLFEAAISAIGRPPARIRNSPQPVLQYNGSDLLQDGPLVSVLIPTFDRPTLLRYALQSCRAQTYRNVETVVVVDGGPRLDALAREFPQTRFIHMPENNPLLSTNTGFAETRGKYVTMLNDDDLFFPHHVAALVTALERSNGAVAHADVLTAYLRGSDEAWFLYGFESNMSDAADTSSLLVNNKVGATSVMLRKDCFPDGAPFDGSIPLYRDYELWLRLSLKYDLIHVEKITSCYTTRNQGAGQQSVVGLDQAAAAYKAIYARHAVQNRPNIEQRRNQTVQMAERGIAGPVTRPAGEVAPVLWPPFASTAP